MKWLMDDDYITRGLIYLLLWFILGWPVCAFIGALLAGLGGAAVAVVLVVPAGVWGYAAFLRWHERRH